MMKKSDNKERKGGPQDKEKAVARPWNKHEKQVPPRQIKWLMVDTGNYRGQATEED